MAICNGAWNCCGQHSQACAGQSWPGAKLGQLSGLGRQTGSHDWALMMPTDGRLLVTLPIYLIFFLSFSFFFLFFSSFIAPSSFSPSLSPSFLRKQLKSGHCVALISLGRLRGDRPASFAQTGPLASPQT